MTRLCGVCGEPATGWESNTELLEQYEPRNAQDDGIGQPNDPSRWTAKPYRTSVPGRTTVTWQPCGHSRITN